MRYTLEMLAPIRETMLACSRAAGRVLIEHWRQPLEIRTKGSPSNIVTQADLASERVIVEAIRERFPTHRILSEECGLLPGEADVTWVIDPLDGTSNFAAGLPWFGVMIAVLAHATPVLAALYLPVDDALYFAERGAGAFRDGTRIAVTADEELSHALCAFSMDAAASANELERQGVMLASVAHSARNVRTTNCLVDFAYTADGRFGGCINLNTCLWDIAAPALLLGEAGGILTTADGAAIAFDIGPETPQRKYAVVGGSRAIHRQLLAITS